MSSDGKEGVLHPTEHGVYRWEEGLHTTKYHFMYLRAILCTFQISVDFYYVERGAGEGGNRERVIECILYGYS
jgi:hypothetical protein